jgi:hypothetical protein
MRRLDQCDPERKTPHSTPQANASPVRMASLAQLCSNRKEGTGMAERIKREMTPLDGVGAADSSQRPKATSPFVKALKVWLR